MSDIRSRPATDAYREGWDRIFQRAPRKTLREEFAADFPNTWGVGGSIRSCNYPGCVLAEHGYETGHWIATAR